MSEEQELITSNLGPNDLPTEGEWKRAVTDRREMEHAFRVHEAKPDSDVVTIQYPLRGERFIAVPRGAHVVAFQFPIIPAKEVN